MRVFREPCYFAEAVYLLYYFVNEVSYEEEFARICKCYCRKADEEEEGMMRRIQELTRVLSLRSCRGWRNGLTVAWPS